MWGLLRFIGGAVRRDIATSITSGVLLAMGVNVQEIARVFWQEPPALITHWASPWVIVLVAIFLMAWIFYRQVEWLRVSGPNADIRIHNIIDYIVNDSNLYLPPSFPNVTGIEHDEAMKKLDERLSSSAITLWGKRQSGAHANDLQFERSKTQIPTEYWNDCEL